MVSAESVEAAAVEVEMLDARLITQPQQLNESRTRARDFEGNLLDRAQAGAIVRRIVHALSSDAEYQDTDVRPTAVEHPVAVGLSGRSGSTSTAGQQTQTRFPHADVPAGC